jgi:NAD(P)-dependent dehydrogenase (short-subunit alcohol dehydrogenase family)
MEMIDPSRAGDGERDMKEFHDKVAVITGAASGIGRGIAERCAQEGMKVVLADVEEAALAQTGQELRANGATILAVRTDVSQANEIEALARQTLKAFGAVHLLVNNAGVGAGGSIWESTLADWEWVMGVNLWGVIHGLRTFCADYAGAGYGGSYRQYGFDRRIAAVPSWRLLSSDQTRSRRSIGATLLLAGLTQGQDQSVRSLSGLGQYQDYGFGTKPSRRATE